MPHDMDSQSILVTTYCKWDAIIVVVVVVVNKAQIGLNESVTEIKTLSLSLLLSHISDHSEHPNGHVILTPPDALIEPGLPSLAHLPYPSRGPEADTALDPAWPRRHKPCPDCHLHKPLLLWTSWCSVWFWQLLYGQSEKPRWLEKVCSIPHWPDALCLRLWRLGRVCGHWWWFLLTMGHICVTVFVSYQKYLLQINVEDLGGFLLHYCFVRCVH